MRAEPWLVAALALSAGCAPPSASEELNALTHSLFRDWGDADPAAMEEDVTKLDPLLAALPLDQGVDARSFRVEPLARGDLDGITWPMDRDPKNAIGACVARRSRWPIGDNAQFIISPDQLPAEPTAKSYQRTFVDPTDPSCFPGQGCPVLFTDNQITRDTPVLTISFLLHKNLRWVRLGPDRQAIAARSYIDHPFPGEKSGTAMQQSYSIDVFLGEPDARTIRYQCSWGETDVGFALDDDLALSVLANGVDRAMEATDTAIGKQLHGE